jgi:hypothetical protein
MKNKFVLVMMLLAMLMSGCAAKNNGPSGMHKVDWYRQHPAARHKELKWCNNDTPRQKLAACLNAYQASMEGTPTKTPPFSVGGGHGELLP